MATRETIRVNVGRRLHGQSITGTSTSGTASTLVVNNDARFFASSRLSADLYQGSLFMPTAGVEDGNVRLCTTYAPSTGTVTVSPVWGTGPTTDTFEFWSRLHPHDVNDAIDRALRKMYHDSWTPITMVADGDMELEDGTSADPANYTSTNATTRKDTDAADVSHVLHGSRSLSVLTTAANGYAQTASIKVESGAGYYVWADVRASGAFTARLQVWDVTNGAAIGANQDWANNDWGTVKIGFTAPAGCDNVAFRLIGVENNATCHWDNIQLVRNGGYWYNLPTWVQNPAADVRGLIGFSGDRPREMRPAPWAQIEKFSNPRAANPGALYLNASGGSGRPFLRAVRPYLGETDTLSTDAATTSANVDWIVEATLVECYSLLVDQSDGADSDLWEKRRQEAAERLIRNNNRYQQPKGAQPVKVAWGAQVS